MDGEGQVPQGNPYMAPMHQFGSSIVVLTNPESELNKMEMTFKNVRPNAKGELVAAGDPLMNDYGINSVIGTVQTLVNQVTVLSNLSKTDIPILMDFLADTLCKDLMINRVEYGIKSFAAREKIFFTALASSYVTMKRAFEEGDKRFWKGSTQEITSRVESDAGKKKGLFSSLNPWGK